MTQKLTIALCVFLLIFQVNVKAQNAAQQQRPTPEQRAKMQTEHMKEALNLSPEQEKSVYKINLKYAMQVDKTVKPGTGKEDRRKEMQKTGDEKDAELKGVLTAEQYAKHIENKTNMQNIRGGPEGRMHGPNGPNPGGDK